MPRIKILGLNQSMGHCFVLIRTSLHPGYHQISRETSLNAKGRIIVQLLTSFHPGREVVPLMLFIKTEEEEFNFFFFFINLSLIFETMSYCSTCKMLLN